MLSIAFLYSRDVSDIAEQMQFAIKEVQTNWKANLFPILSEKEQEIWSAIKNGSFKADIIVFLASAQFLLENDSNISNLTKTNNTNYRFAGINIGQSSHFPKMQISLDVELLLDTNVQHVANGDANEIWDNLIQDIVGYCKIVELANENKENIRKEKRDKNRKQTSLMFGVVLIYLAGIICAMALLFSDSSSWSRQSAEMMLIFLCVFSAFIICALSYFVITGIQKRREHAEQTKFGNDLDSSLSRNPKVSAADAISHSTLELVANAIPLLGSDLLDPVFSLLTNSKTGNANTPHSEDQVDAEMSRAIGEDVYLPLGHLKLNWKQMKGYYDISKKQATAAFSLAIVICFIGIAIFVFAVLSPIFPIFSSTNSLIPIIGTIGGTIVELFAGTILVVYKKTLSQMNLYHEALADYQRYLSCVNLVDMVSDIEKRNLLYEQIISIEMSKLTNPQKDANQ